MALTKKALTTVSTVQDELGISGSTSTLERYIRQASDFFRRLTGRRWYEETEYVEEVAGYRGKRLLVFDHLPIDQIRTIEIKIDDTTDELNSGAYEIEDAQSGFIRRIDGSSWELTESYFSNIEPEYTGENLKLYRVTYDGGYVTPEDASQNNKTRDLPYDIEDAVIDFVTSKYVKKGSGSAVDSESIMSASIDYQDTSDVDGVLAGTTPYFSTVVKQYRNPKSMVA